MAKQKQRIAESISAVCEAPVTITAAEGESNGPPKFSVLAYTGGLLRGALRMNDGTREDVITDLSGMEYSRSLIANLDHESTQRVGHITDKINDGKQLSLSGVASAATEARDQVVGSASNGGFPWQASIEADPLKLEIIKAGKSVVVNGQTFEGPVFVARKSRLRGFAFVSHGADDNTIVSIAASAASKQEKKMKAEVESWIKAMLPSVDIEALSDEEKSALEANYAGQQTKPAKAKASDNPFEVRRLEATRRNEISAIAETRAALRESDVEWIDAVEKMRDHAITAGMTVQEFKNELYESTIPLAHTVAAPRSRSGGITGKVIEAAIAVAGRLGNVEKAFDEQTLEAAHKEFRDGISLSELFYVCAEANGYRGRRSGRITLEVQRAAFGVPGQRQIHAQGWSTINIADVLANNQNKFLREGWMSVDMTPMRIAATRPVTDFREITTVSLTGGLMFEKVGAAGEIKHGTLGGLTYGNKADTYAIMLAITRQDMVNDDLGALTAVPRRIGRGGALKLNDIFWTEFLNPSVANFFHSDNANVSTVDGTVSLAGLDQANVIFSSQTDPDGYPIGSVPKIWLVPTAQHTAAMHLMNDELILGSSGTNGNIWRGRFRVESSPYMSNAAYSGYSAVASYLLADPSDMPVIEIVALNGRVEPTVETAETDFNTLGVQFRGYSDVGVRMQEPRGGVRLDGTAA